MFVALIVFFFHGRRRFGRGLGLYHLFAVPVG
jgi:hypothetical protein